MAADSVVEHFQIFKDFSPGLFFRLKALPEYVTLLERRKELFGHLIVITIARAVGYVDLPNRVSECVVDDRHIGQDARCCPPSVSVVNVQSFEVVSIARACTGSLKAAPAVSPRNRAMYVYCFPGNKLVSTTVVSAAVSWIVSMTISPRCRMTGGRPGAVSESLSHVSVQLTSSTLSSIFAWDGGSEGD